MVKIDKANKKAQTKIIKLAKKEVKKITQELKAELYYCNDCEKKKAIRKNGYKRYTKIYLLYGQQVYLKCVPRDIRLRDAEELYNQERFITIYEKHGKKVYKSIRNTVIAKDIEQETGSKVKGELAQATREAMEIIKKTLITFTSTITALVVGGNVLLLKESEANHKQSIKENANEINEYLDSVEEYSEQVKAMKLTDTENIMKVMDDMWCSIQGYGQPQKDLAGCLGLDMYKKNGIGLCRNMADDCARKLNEINPEYNARIIAVDLYTKKGEVETANIKQVKATNIKQKKQEENTNKEYGIIEKQILETVSKLAETQSGNHAVIIMDVPKDNTTLIVDPTNPAIGVYKNVQFLNRTRNDFKKKNSWRRNITWDRFL